MGYAVSDLGICDWQHDVGSCDGAADGIAPFGSCAAFAYCRELKTYLFRISWHAEEGVYVIAIELLDGFHAL